MLMQFALLQCLHALLNKHLMSALQRSLVLRKAPITARVVAA
jgi:hypothetical protein